MRVFGSVSHGVWGFLAFGWWGILRAPWDVPLFSERYGYEKYTRLCAGWRFKVRRVKGVDTP